MVLSIKSRTLVRFFFPKEMINNFFQFLKKINVKLYIFRQNHQQNIIHISWYTFRKNLEHYLMFFEKIMNIRIVHGFLQKSLTLVHVFLQTNQNVYGFCEKFIFLQKKSGTLVHFLQKIIISLWFVAKIYKQLIFLLQKI